MKGGPLSNHFCYQMTSAIVILLREICSRLEGKQPCISGGFRGIGAARIRGVSSLLWGGVVVVQFSDPLQTQLAHAAESPDRPQR